MSRFVVDIDPLLRRGYRTRERLFYWCDFGPRPRPAYRSRCRREPRCHPHFHPTMGHARRPHRSGRADSGSRAQAASTSAQAAATGAAPVRNPYSPAYHHSYRHGVIPTIKVEAKMHRWAHNHPGIAALSANDLNYGGGIDGIGVTTGQEKVYLVFYGSQWGTQGTNGSGNVTLSGDPSGEAPYVQQLHRGLGTAGELW